MVLLSVIQVGSSLATLGDFMVILFSSHPKEGSCFFFCFFSFWWFIIADDLSVQIQGHKSGTPLS